MGVKKLETKEETKALAVAPTQTEIQAAEAAQSQEVVASDVLIPRLLLMQGISPLVATRKAQIGDFIRSTTGEKLGDPEHPVDIVPISMVNTWINFETAKSAGTQKPAFRGIEPRNATNELLPWEFEGQGGQEMFRRKAISLYALVPADVAKYDKEIERAMASGEAPDLNSTVLPVIITFQSTSFKHAGRKCASFFNNVRANAAKLRGKMDIAPFQYILTLKAIEEKSGTNSWWCYDFESPKSLKDPKIREEAARWSLILKSQKIRTDDAGVEAEDTQSGSGSSAAEMEV